MALDSLLAEVLRAATLPDNYLVLNSELDWFKLYKAADEKNAILCIEFHDESFPACRGTNQHFLELARRFQNLPFVQVRLSNSNKWHLVRKSVGGVDFVPCILIIAFLPDGKQRAKYEGERDIEIAIRRGSIQDIIKEFQNRRNLVNSIEGMIANEILKLVERDQVKEEENQTRVRELESKIGEMEETKEEEAKKRARAREAVERRDKEILEERQRNRPIILDELKNETDIEGLGVGRLKDMFRRLHINLVGITEKAELLGKLYQEFPELKFKQRNVYDTYSYPASGGPPSLGAVGPTPPASPLSPEDSIFSLSDKDIETLPAAKLKKYVNLHSLQDAVPLNERSEMINAIKKKRDSSFKAPSAQLLRQDSSIYKIEINELSGKVVDLTEKLTMTKILSTCHLADFEILQTHKVPAPDSICQHTVRCNRPELPDREKRYTLKGVFNYFNSGVSVHSLGITSEFEILSTLQPHPNIVYHFAIFHDRPTKQVGCTRSDLRDQIALFSITENLPYTIISFLSKNHKNSAVEPNDYLNWMKQLISTFSFLTDKNLYLRSIRHENILYDPNTKTLKLIGFETAIHGQTVPFSTHMTSIGDLNSYLPPEVLNAVPGPSNFLDYTAHYAWSVGALSYDLACNPSPFTHIDASQYRDIDIPPINSLFPYGSLSRANSKPISPQYSKMVSQMLSFWPQNRPKLEDVLSSV